MRRLSTGYAGLCWRVWRPRTRLVSSCGAPRRRRPTTAPPARAGCTQSSRAKLGLAIGGVRRVFFLARAPKDLPDPRGPRTAPHPEGGKRTGRNPDNVPSNRKEAGVEGAPGRQAETPLAPPIPRSPDSRFFDYPFPIPDVRVLTPTESSGTLVDSAAPLRGRR